MTTKAHEPRLARVAAVVADPARSRMLCLLLSGECATAGELAKAAGVAPSTASEHLRKLLDAGLVAGESRGRHRYFRLADPQVAHALEALALVAERGSRGEAWDHPGRRRLRVARCCYGHLAGQLGVRLFGTLLERDALRAAPDGYELTDAGRTWLSSLGMSPSAPGSRRRFAYACMDWSERRDHLAGQLASALFQHFVAKGWLRRTADRVVEVTPRGVQELLPQLDGGMSRVA
jgi:DNA-binding transcriptional ArsR family regulator